MVTPPHLLGVGNWLLLLAALTTRTSQILTIIYLKSRAQGSIFALKRLSGDWIWPDLGEEEVECGVRGTQVGFDIFVLYIVSWKMVHLQNRCCYLKSVENDI